MQLLVEPGRLPPSNSVAPTCWSPSLDGVLLTLSSDGNLPARDVTDEDFDALIVIFTD